MTKLLALGVTALALTACTDRKAAAPPAPPAPRYDRMPRAEFNRRAQELFLPLFWRSDANGNGAIEPAELAILWGPKPVSAIDYVSGSNFTLGFAVAYEAMVKPTDLSALTPEERRRRELVRDELAQGRPNLVETDLSKATPQDRAVMEPLERAARLIDRLYMRQMGTAALAAQLVPGDLASAALFHRNHGAICVAPKTENEPSCSALPSRPKKVVGLYPAGMQADPKFCDKILTAPNSAALMDHFSVVVEADGQLAAQPYPAAYGDDMEAVARELELAAKALVSPDETAFRNYLTEAAKAFRTNDWEPANAAWVAMGPTNSKWYARIGPDEVYAEPCALKALFAFQLARINPDSIAWQQKLEPVKGELERTVAALAGPPYKAREVAFKLPDFIDVVLNAGDAREPHGATIGQSLPNWGAVADKGGRTVAMTNLYTDADARQTLESQMSSLFCPATMKLASTDPALSVMSTVLHEAAHNLGPARDYRANGKSDDEAFGGPLASTMEELKAQTAALYFAGWLADKGIVTKDEAAKAAVRDVAWAFGHVSRGMYDSTGSPRNYSQLASIQLGWLHSKGVLAWHPEEVAANTQDKGCLELDTGDRWKAAVDGLARRVFAAKAKGDRADAEKMKAEFVDGESEWKQLHTVIAQRWLRAPKATFVYAIKR